ncbi:MAG: helix-turn-helix domain-containing protein [Candidatus Omnitrophota bacterium]
MKKVKLERVDKHLAKELKNEQFKKAFEIERAKVALAQKIAELRQDQNLTQTALAKKLGVSQQFISQIETGMEKNLTLETLLNIASSLGRDIKISFIKPNGKHSYLRVA